MKEHARRAVAARLVADTVKAAGDDAKREIADAFDLTGADRVRVTDDDGTALGTVSRTKGRVTARVVDAEAFAAWVAQAHPEAIVTTVDPAWRDRLLVAVRALGDPVDSETGEVIPGVELAEGAPSISVRPTDAARDRMAALLADTGLLGLPGGTSE
ncbi:hypothetical protein [Stackebrandtia soli]|uniref:hypothetical protein n=1 Tax=Stackebrandtia soli TaxID=1892856 RepID=UPI0039E91368